MLWIDNVRSEERRAFDWLTFLLAAFASTGTVYAIEKLGSGGIQWRRPVALLVVSLACGVLAVLAARRRPTLSFIDIESLKIKTYSNSIYGASIYRISVSVLPFLLPLMFQIAFGMSAFHSGLYLLALFGGDLTMKVFVIQVLRRFGFRRILIVNGVLSAVSICLCATLSPSTPIVLILLLLVLNGACRSTQFTCLATLAYTEIPAPRMSQANGFLSAVMQLSMGMGVAVGAIALRLGAFLHGHSVVTPQLRDFHVAIFVIGILALGSPLGSLGLRSDAGADTSGHRPEMQPAALRRNSPKSPYKLRAGC